MIKMAYLSAFLIGLLSACGDNSQTPVNVTSDHVATVKTETEEKAQASNPLAPKEGEFHVATEMNVYDKISKAQSAGMPLAVPGDKVHYTYVLDNKYAVDPGYVLSRVLLGVHTRDKDKDNFTTDTAPEWGRILINGEARNILGMNVSSDFIEIASDTERGGLPYGFVGTDMIRNNQLALTIENLNSKGTTAMEGDWGDFNFLRGGLHVYYKKKAP